MMNYSIGSVADLISGKNTPNKPKIIKKDIIQSPAVSKRPQYENYSNKSNTNGKSSIKKSKKKVIKHHNQLIDPLEESRKGPVSIQTNSEISAISEQNVQTPIKQRDEEQENKTIFVGNVPIEANKLKLKKLFGKFGNVESVRLRCAAPDDPNVSKKVAVIKKRFHPDRKSLHCFIRFQNREDACKALEMNGFNYKNHHLRVNMAKNEEKPDENKALFIGNVPFDAEEEDLWTIFETVGKISSVRLVRDSKTSMGKGFGYVNFESSDSVELALERNDFQLKKRLLRISRCSNSAGKKSKNKKGRKGQRNFKRDQGEKKVEKKVKPSADSNVDYQGTVAKTKKKKKLDKGAIRKKRIIKLLTTPNKN